MWPIQKEARRFRPRLEALEDRLCPATTTLAAPTLLTITPAGSTAATLSWTNVANETGYTILLWNGTQAVPLSTVGADVTTATVDGLPGGQQAWLRVEAFNAATQADSAWLSVQLPVDRLAGAGGLQATPASPTEIDLHWTLGSGQTGFHVLEWDGTKAVTIATLLPGHRHDAVTGLTPATVYYFAIEAFNASNSQTTSWLKATTPPQPITAPTHLTGTATDTQVTLSWTAGQGATGYRVYEWQDDQAVQVGQTDGSTTQVTVTGLQAGTGYWFYVQAYNPSNTANSPWKLVATTSVSNPLLPPGNVTAKNVGVGKVELDWTPSTGAVGYYVYSWNGTAWNIVSNPTATAKSAVVTGLTNGTHYFVVMAYTANAVQYADSPVLKVTV